MKPKKLPILPRKLPRELPLLELEDEDEDEEAGALDCEVEAVVVALEAEEVLVPEDAEPVALAVPVVIADWPADKVAGRTEVAAAEPTASLTATIGFKIPPRRPELELVETPRSLMTELNSEAAPETRFTVERMGATAELNWKTFKVLLAGVVEVPLRKSCTIWYNPGKKAESLKALTTRSTARLDESTAESKSLKLEIFKKNAIPSTKRGSVTLLVAKILITGGTSPDLLRTVKSVVRMGISSLLERSNSSKSPVSRLMSWLKKSLTSSRLANSRVLASRGALKVNVKHAKRAKKKAAIFIVSSGS